MSFDDLQFSGFGSSQRPSSEGFCSICNDLVTVERHQCMGCGFPCQVGSQPPAGWRRDQAGASDAATTTGTANGDLQSLLHRLTMQRNNNAQAATANNNANTNGEHGGEDQLIDTAPAQPFVPLNVDLLREMLTAQQGLNIDQLMNTMMADTSYGSTGAAKKYIDELQPHKLTDRDFVYPVLQIRPGFRDLQPTISNDLGVPLIALHKIDEDEHKHPHDDDTPIRNDTQTHVSAPLMASNPLSGSGIQNTDDVQGSVMFMTRGMIPFGDKAVAAEKLGAKALIIGQSDQQWPYTMTDSKRTAKDVKIPVIMVSHRDSQLIKQALQPTTNSKPLTANVTTQIRSLQCAICREDYQIGSEAVKLPCNHYFCRDCIVPWLEKKSTCCLCRFQLPTDDGAAEKLKKEQAERAHNLEQLQHSMLG